MNNTDSMNSEYPQLNDALQNHLIGCEQCLKTLEQNPVPNLGGKSEHCPEWFKIIREWSQNEGKVNNIVARDEFGNEAWHRK